jgi:hypothetical protein
MNIIIKLLSATYLATSPFIISSFIETVRVSVHDRKINKQIKHKKSIKIDRTNFLILKFYENI